MVTNITHLGEKISRAEQEMVFEFGFVMVVRTNWTSGTCYPIQNLWQEVQGTPVAQQMT